ncbi:MAG: zinc metalloprotease HtpX [Bdellovibrionales bacterium GWB1_55_8]|nr:MAG: zinc metalloprotease HtpX [Bdellovibrionales bacterium GWB1_55_8]
MFKRIFLFLALNFLVIITLSILTQVLGIQPYLTAYGIDYGSLMAFCLVWGMGGAFISLAMSRMMAKWMMGVRVVDPDTRDPALQELVQTVHSLARSAKLPAMPEVGVYDSQEINAFATGPTKSRALVAVSTGLLSRMRREEVEGVLGHEVAHIANGDMVTMTLIQGVVNAFVMFLARAIAFAIAQALRSDRDDERGGISHLAYFGIQIALEIVFMILGSIVVAWFSRYREFRADKGGATLAGRDSMIRALEALRRTYDLVDPGAQPAVQTLKISTKRTGIMQLFSTHPPLEERIARLQLGG